MIEIAEICGFCAGAKCAFENTLKAIQDNSSKRIVLFKELLNNRDVVDMLKSNGVVQIDKKENLRLEDVIIIRAHGETKETIKYFDDRGFKYINCTCQKVSRIHESVEKKYNEGYKIFIIAGKKEHPEVIGSHSRCNNEGYVISGVEDIDSVCGLSNEKIFIVAQTTVAREKFVLLSETIKKKFAACHIIEVMDSLCDLQEKIQTSSVNLAGQCETMIVIGGEDSANTKELYNKCKQVCPGTHWVYNRKFFYDTILEKIDFSMKIGITGGASTPIKIIKECKALLTFKKFYEDVRKKIMEKIHEYNQILLQDNNSLFQGAIEQFAAIGESEKAKLIRGTLLMLGYKTAKGRYEDYSLDLAAAYELFETSILVHDDVFDKAKKRRDVITIHEKIGNNYVKGHDDRNDLIRFTAQCIAVCVGDLGFYFLNQMILNAYKDDQNLVPVLRYFNDIVIKTIKGELLDIVLPLEEQLKTSSEKNIEHCVFEIDAMKTAGYSTIGPFCLGLILGGAGQADLDKFEELLLKLGIAFQIKDDWLNIYGSPEQGKPIGNDISEFKMTLFYSEVCKDEEWKNKLLEYYGKDSLSSEAVESVKEIFEKTGARVNAEKTMTKYFEASRALLDGITFKNEEDRDILLGFILYLELRSR